MAFLNENQRRAFELAIKGHNFLLMGSAGTGKSTVVTMIAKELQSMDKNVALTCSTGIACQVYKDVKDETGEKIWICPICKEQEDGSTPTIGCDICDEWFHWHCVGISTVPEEDMTQCSQPANLKTSLEQDVRDMLAKDWRFTVRIISSELGASKTSVYWILTEELNMSKVSARWVPGLLSDEQKAKRVECSMEFLNQYAI